MRNKKTMGKPGSTMVVEYDIKEVLGEIRTDIRMVADGMNKKSDKSELTILAAAIQGVQDGFRADCSKLTERVLKLETGGTMAEDIRKQWRATNWQWFTILVAIATAVIALLRH
jgi:hypothetical protein